MSYPKAILTIGPLSANLTPSSILMTFNKKWLISSTKNLKILSFRLNKIFALHGVSVRSRIHCWWVWSVNKLVTPFWQKVSQEHMNSMKRTFEPYRSNPTNKYLRNPKISQGTLPQFTRILFLAIIWTDLQMKISVKTLSWWVKMWNRTWQSSFHVHLGGLFWPLALFFV